MIVSADCRQTRCTLLESNHTNSLNYHCDPALISVPLKDVAVAAL